MKFTDTPHTNTTTKSGGNQPLPDFTILASKNVHSGSMSGFVWNGGEIPLEIGGVTTKITVAMVKLNDKFGSLQVRVYNEAQAPKQQTFIRAKKVQVSNKPGVEQGDALQTTINTEDEEEL